MTREEFIKRCETAWDSGHTTPEILRLMDRWVDFVLRFEGGQMSYVADFLEQERQRLDSFHHGRTLAGDTTGYKIVELCAILTHPCQQCAEDLEAWWTRPAFCSHKRVVVTEVGAA